MVSKVSIEEEQPPGLLDIARARHENRTAQRIEAGVIGINPQGRDWTPT
jgi:hypothetical protein